MTFMDYVFIIFMFTCYTNQAEEQAQRQEILDSCKPIIVQTEGEIDAVL